MKDSWCSKYEMPDGTVVSGGAAREARFKAAGGAEAHLRRIVNEAVQQAFQVGVRTASAVPANDKIVRRLRRAL
ncbi:hypothetical protein L602_001500000780 [Cupriavidus gilardii J11]|uniref:Uncharacterized protein n=1 Tax=Cupriavidus gilardii J11 TaxID=936133 RepID=A0A562BRN2_9BURK|nr:hypothetical protein [Cupriavidus gilardii]TWG87945.1 hypothetical protein L602_001500000780 [Cupriavidus gilardii J11]